MSILFGHFRLPRFINPKYVEILCNSDDTFVSLSVKELGFYASHGDRLLHTIQQRRHKCHVLRVESALQYIKNTVIKKQWRNNERFDCVEGSSGNKGDTIRIEDYTFVGGDFKAALNILQMQPIGALLHVFQEYWDIKKVKRLERNFVFQRFYCFVLKCLFHRRETSIADPRATILSTVVFTQFLLWMHLW